MLKFVDENVLKDRRPAVSLISMKLDMLACFAPKVNAFENKLEDS